MHTRATSTTSASVAALKEENSKDNNSRNGVFNTKHGVPKRALGDITNFGSNSNAIGFPAKKPNSTGHQDASTAATKIRRTVATKPESRTSAHARRAKAVQLAAAVGKDTFDHYSSAADTRSISSTATGASPMSTTGAESTLRTKRTFGAFNRSLAVELNEFDSEDESEHSFCGPPLPSGVLDIDVEDLDNHLSESRFAVEIHRNLQERELSFMARYNYMDAQGDITTKMRAILIDWLVDVHLKFKLQAETLFLTVNIIDRFLEQQPVLRRKLQLVGVTAMLIACKYEEIYAPITKDFVYISDKAYTEEEILKMEAIMLNKLDFTITVPSALTFLERTLKAMDYCARMRGELRMNPQVAHLARYCVELAIQDSSMLRFRPSEQAASSVLLASKLVYGEERWCTTMQFHSGNWDTSSLNHCELVMRKLLIHEQDSLGTNKLTAIKRKYSHVKYSEISTHVASIDLEVELSTNSMDICGRD